MGATEELDVLAIVEGPQSMEVMDMFRNQDRIHIEDGHPMFLGHWVFTRFELNIQYDQLMTMSFRLEKIAILGS